MSHPDRMLRLAQRMNPEDPTAAADLLDSESALIERLFASADILPLPPVPQELSDSLTNIMGLAQELNVIGATAAALIHDSRDSRELVGVRGAKVATSEAWTAIFSADNADLIIDGTPVGGDRVTISGHVLRRSATPGTCHIVERASQREALADDIGQFELGDFAPGSYELDVQTGTQSFSCTLDI